MDYQQLSGHLRALTRAEIADEREADEAAARTYHERSRDLAGAVVALSSKSTRVIAHVAGVSFAGSVVHVAGDLATLRTNDGTETDLRLGSVLFAADHSPGRTQPMETSGPESFIARMRQLELESRHVRILTVGGEQHIEGPLRVVAADHVIVETAGHSWLVPGSSIVAMIVTGIDRPPMI